MNKTVRSEAWDTFWHFFTPSYRLHFRSISKIKKLFPVLPILFQARLQLSYEPLTRTGQSVKFEIVPVEVFVDFVAEQVKILVDVADFRLSFFQMEKLLKYKRFELLK